MNPRKWTLPDPTVLVTVLLALAMICALLGVAGAVAAVLSALPGRSLQTTDVVLALASLAGGGGLAGALWALAWLCRRQYFQALQERNLLDRLASLGSPQPPAPTAAPASPPPQANDDELLRQLRELNINLLLDPVQRQLKRQFLVERHALSLAVRLEEAIQAEDLSQAQTLLEELVGISPDNPRLAELRPRFEQLSRQQRQRQLEEARRRVADVMAVGDFAQAQVLAQRLLEKQPDWPEARQLLEHVRRERQLYLGEQRSRMVRLVEREAADRHWRSALQAAREMISAFPDSAEAQSIRERLETLSENAALEEARELRDQIRGLFERHQYPQALELARDLVARFPTTAAAEDLRRQMGRLEELAASNPQPPVDLT